MPPDMVISIGSGLAVHASSLSLSSDTGSPTCSLAPSDPTREGPLGPFPDGLLEAPLLTSQRPSGLSKWGKPCTKVGKPIKL